jgi:hypothetical protein
MLKINVTLTLSFLKGGVSLIVCNLLVIVTYLYQVFRQQRDIEVPTQTSPQEMSETDRTTRPIPSPVGTGELTPVSLTEISGAYFTDPISAPRSDDEESHKTNSEGLKP